MIIEKDGAIDWVTFNRPDNLNALSRQFVRELNHYFGSLETNYDVRVVVLKGNGRAFCAGLDMKDPERPLDSTTNTGMKSQRNFSGIVYQRLPQPKL